MASKPSIRFHINRNGKPVAFRNFGVWSPGWVRINYDEAKILEATGGAREIIHGPRLFQPGGYIVKSWTDPNGVPHITTGIKEE